MSNRVLIDQSNNTVTTDTTSTQNNVILSPDNPDVVTVIENTSNIITIGVPGPKGNSGTGGGGTGISNMIYSGSATASISPNKGLVINTSVVQGSGSSAYGYSNFVNGQSDVAFTTESIYRIVFNYPTSSIGYSTGISEDRKTIYKYLTGSYAGTQILSLVTNSLDLTYRFGSNAIGYPITDYKFVLNNRDEITYKGNSYFSTASLTSTGSFATSSYISGAAVMSYSLSNPLPAQIGILGSEITHITFAKSASLSYINLGTSSLNRFWEGYIDDNPYITVPTPFPINFLGRKYNKINVTGQGYIAFDALSTSTSAPNTPLSSSAVPPYPNIKVGAADLSIYKIYTGSDSGTFRLWIQERSDYPVGTPDREYSYIFYSGSERVDLYIDRMVLSTRVASAGIQQISQISDGYTVYSNFSSSIYSGSGYALNIWDTPVTSSTVKVKQLSGNTITAYGSASIEPNLINSDLYYVSFEKRISTGSQYPLAAYSVRNTGSLQNLVISSVVYNSGTDDTTISLASNLQSDYTASIYSSSYMSLNSNNFIDLAVNYMSESVIKSYNPDSSFYSFMASSSFTASSITLYKNTGYSNNIVLTSNYNKLGFRIMSSSYSGDITGSLFISYSVLPAGAYQSVAYGDYSEAHGLGVVASSSFQYVFGKFNESNDTTSTFVVAGGSDDQSRKNLLSVYPNRTSISGSLDISGKLTYDTGSFTISKFGSTFSSSIGLTGFLSVINGAGSSSYFKGSGSNVFKVDGAYSNLITVQDGVFSGSFPSSSVFSVSDIMGLPIFDTFYDSRVAMYQYPDIIFEKTGSSIYLGSTHTTESKVVIKNNLTIDRGSGVTYSMIQASGSTVSLVTSSIDKYYFSNNSASLYYSAIVSGYDTGSREIIAGDIKSTIKFSNGVATLVGVNTRFINSEDSTVNFDVVCGGTSASLEVYGALNKVYKWAATITTQKL